MLLLVNIKEHAKVVELGKRRYANSDMLVFVSGRCEVSQMLRPCLSHQAVIRLILSSLMSALDPFKAGDLRLKSDLRFEYLRLDFPRLL